MEGPLIRGGWIEVLRERLATQKLCDRIPSGTILANEQLCYFLATLQLLNMLANPSHNPNFNPFRFNPKPLIIILIHNPNP